MLTNEICLNQPTNQTNKQTNRKTDQRYLKHNLVCQGGNDDKST